MKNEKNICLYVPHFLWSGGNKIVFAFLKQTFTLDKDADLPSVKRREAKLGISRENEYTFSE